MGFEVPWEGLGLRFESFLGTLGGNLEIWGPIWASFCTILAPFWHLGPPFWRAWGIQGHPTGQQGVPGEIFIDLGWIWGPNWTPIWRHFGQFLHDLGNKFAMRVPGLFIRGLRLEMTLETDAQMC